MLSQSGSIVSYQEFKSLFILVYSNYPLSYDYIGERHLFL